MKHINFLNALLLAPALALAYSPVSGADLEIIPGRLDNPLDGSTQSGNILIYGWHCDAGTIEIIIDDRPTKTAAYGAPRKDTEDKCGDIDNGVGYVFGSQLLDRDETHTIRALADGIEFDRVQFTVDYFDSSFIRGLNSFVEITVPELGKEATLLWQESMQGYVITDVQDLDFSLEDALAAAAGDRSGTWQSAWAAGGTAGVTMEIVQIQDGMTMQPTSVVIRGTGCAEESAQTSPIMSLDRMVSEIVMQDDSEVEMQFLPTESLTAVTGNFVFDSGLCEGLDGVFTMFKQVE